MDVRSGSVVSPADNPYQGPSNRHEVWNIGLRNPWRFSIDRVTGDLYIGDVGENRTEEVNVARAVNARGRGFNFGWNVLEGDDCWSPGCDISGKVLPTLSYAHGDEGACCVIGGYVYRGNAIPGLKGRYFYADYCGQWVRSFRLVGGAVTDEKEWTALGSHGHILSFGEDSAGELYLCTSTSGDLTGDGHVYRIVAGSSSVAAAVR
jgi:glucose/arabinose dehydrogenase